VQILASLLVSSELQDILETILIQAFHVGITMRAAETSRVDGREAAHQEGQILSRCRGTVPIVASAKFEKNLSKNGT